MLAQVPRGGHVEAERRLVEKEDPRVVEQAAGEVQLLALPGREGSDLLVALLGEAGDLDQLVDPPPPLSLREAVELAEHPQLLAGREQAVAGLLAAGDHVDHAPDLGGLVDDVESGDAGPSRWSG